MSAIVGNADLASRVFPPAQTLDGKFLNTVPTGLVPPGGPFHIVRRWLTEGELGIPDHPLGPFHTDTSSYSQPPASGLRITWMGHSSLLIEVDGCRILTDPAWSERASFVTFAGPKRFYEPPLAVDDLPPLDVVLLSHDHYDHLDRPTVEQLAARFNASNVTFLCSLGVGKHLETWGISADRIVELNWGDTALVSGGCEITATPARHFSGRSLWNRNETLWSSFVIRGDRHNLFFGADSGPFPGFKKIGDAYGPFDLTMLEIGAYDNEWPDVHMGPEHAAEAHLDLRGSLMLPIHWGLFNLAFHPWSEPVERLLRVAAQKDIPLLLPRPGVPTEVTGADLNTGWWEQ